jgi:acyl carrier protein
MDALPSGVARDALPSGVARDALTTGVDHDDVLARLRAELAALRPDIAADAPADALFRGDLDVDSLDVLELVARAEAAFGVVVPDEDWQRVASLGSLAAYVVEHAGAP